MSDELPINPNDESDDAAEAEQDFEEICSDEVDRVVEALEALGASTQSENIRFFIDEAANGIYELIYDANEEEELPADDEVSPVDDELPHEEAA